MMPGEGVGVMPRCTCEHAPAMNNIVDTGIFEELERLRRRVNDLERELALRSSPVERHPANLAVLLENTSDAIWSIDNEERLIFFNSTFCRRVHELFGKVPNLGRQPDDFAPPE